MIVVQLPYHLRELAHVKGDVRLEVPAPVTQRAILDVLEAQYPALRGTIRDHLTGQRRPYLRFFACGKDYSLQLPDAELPEAVSRGTEPFMVVGATAGG